MKTIRRILEVIGALAAILGLVLGAKELYQWSRPSPEDYKITQSERSLLIDANNIHLEWPHVEANEIIIDGQQVDVPRNAMLVANNIKLSGGSSLHGTEFSIITSKISGGLIDVSGDNGAHGRLEVNGRTSPETGQEGGSLWLLAAIVDSTLIRANGGTGGNGLNGRDGTPGRPGADGRNGDCAGFGGYKGAQAGSDGHPGGAGENGQNGADGGRGGTVDLFVPTGYRPNAEVSGGTGGSGGIGGAGGSGGPGGRGGSGCVGLGGSQPNEKNGRPGSPGPSGSNGNDGDSPGAGSINYHDIDMEIIPTAIQECRTDQGHIDRECVQGKLLEHDSVESWRGNS